MFNPELKQRFMSEREGEAVLPNNYLQRQFNKAEAMETQLDKDISNFTFYEILEFYKLYNTASHQVLEVLNSQLSTYTQWCLQQNLVADGQNHYLELRTEDYLSCTNKAIRNAKIFSRETVLNWISDMPNPRDQFIILGLFEGIKGKDFCELAKLRIKDVEGRIAHLCTGRDVEISEELADIIYNCNLAQNYYSMSGGQDKVMPLINRGYIVKDYPNTLPDVSDFQRGRQIYNSVQRIMKHLNLFTMVSANSIYESGKLDTIKRNAAKRKMTCSDYLYSDYSVEVKIQYNCNIVNKTYLAVYKDYLV